MEIRYRFDGAKLYLGLERVSEKFDVALFWYTISKADYLQAQMKSERPWTDRTGEAKRRLTAHAVKKREGLYDIILSHGVEYGIWLELANEKNFAILQPTVQKYGPEMLEDIRELMSKLKV